MRFVHRSKYNKDMRNDTVPYCIFNESPISKILVLVAFKSNIAKFEDIIGSQIVLVCNTCICLEVHICDRNNLFNRKRTVVFFTHVTIKIGKWCAFPRVIKARKTQFGIL